jgi:hypothetical protein
MVAVQGLPCAPPPPTHTHIHTGNVEAVITSRYNLIIHVQYGTMVKLRSEGKSPRTWRETCCGVTSPTTSLTYQSHRAMAQASHRGVLGSRPGQSMWDLW